MERDEQMGKAGNKRLEEIAFITGEALTVLPGKERSRTEQRINSSFVVEQRERHMGTNCLPSAVTGAYRPVMEGSRSAKQAINDSKKLLS